MLGLYEALVREKVADHERLVARLTLERAALACQRDYKDHVKRAPVVRRPSWFGAVRLAFRS